MKSSKKLLICTQKVDKNDSVLGFFHGWIIEFSKRFDSIIVICLEKGQYDLPDNVKVLSLGKEKTVSRFKYIINFYKYIWKYKKDYENVFVHMNAEYVALGGLFWKLLRKPTFIWYNHKVGKLIAKIAFSLADKIFYTSEYAYSAKYSKAMQMKAGIDSSIFKPRIEIKQTKNSILFLSRISPVKKLDILLRAVKILDDDNFDFVLNIYGDAPDRDKAYLEQCKNLAKELVNSDKIIWHGEIAFHKIPEIYNQNELFVNLTPAGSFDKTVLEAMCSGSLVAVSNQSFHSIINKELIFEQDNPSDLARKIIFALNLGDDDKKIFMERNVTNGSKHDLSSLIQDIYNEYAS